MIPKLLLTGVAAAALVADTANAQPPATPLDRGQDYVSDGAGRPPSGVAPARAQNRAAAVPQPTYRDILDNDVEQGALTPEQAEALAQRGEQRFAEFERRARAGGDALARDLETQAPELDQNLENSGVRGNGSGGRRQAEAFVEAGAQGFAIAEQATYEMGRGVEHLVNLGEQNARDRYDAIVANPNSTPAQRANAEAAIRAVRDFGTTMGSKTGTMQYQAAANRRAIDERREEIVTHIEERIRNEGADPRNWQNPPPAAAPTGRAPPPAAPPPPPPPPPAPPAGANAGSPPTRPAGGGQRGTIPPADPYEGLRVPDQQANAAPAARPQPRQPQQQAQAPAPRGNAGRRGDTAADAAAEDTAAPGTAASRGSRAADAANVGTADLNPPPPPSPAGSAAHRAGTGAGAGYQAALQGLIDNLPRPGQVSEAPSTSTRLLVVGMILSAGAMLEQQGGAARGRGSSAAGGAAGAGAQGDADIWADDAEWAAMAALPVADLDRAAADLPEIRRGGRDIPETSGRRITAARPENPPGRPQVPGLSPNELAALRAQRGANAGRAGAGGGEPPSAGGRAGTSNQTAYGASQPVRDPFAAPAQAGGSGSAQTTPATLEQQRRPVPVEQPRQPGGPSYPQTRPRTTPEQAEAARNGQWGPGDSFGGATQAASRADQTAVPPDPVDIARNAIEDRNDAVLAAWNRYAENVYYDEDGVLRRRPSPAPAPAAPPPGAAAGRGNAAAGVPEAGAAPTAWDSFEAGGTVTVAELESIYEGWDINTAPPGSSGRSLSAAGTSLRHDWYLLPAGDSVSQIAADRANGVLVRSASEMGLPQQWGSVDYAGSEVRVNGRRGPAPGSLGDIMRQRDPLHPSLQETALNMDSPWNYRPLSETAPDLARGLYGPLWSDRRYGIVRDPTGRFGRFSLGAELAGFTGAMTRDEMIRILRASGLEGLRRLLSQPFNVLLTWGPDAYDIDLHMTGPSGAGTTGRFHIYFAQPGSLNSFPFVQLIRDCVCASGSEVILMTQLLQGGVYRVSAFNYGNQSTTSTQLSTNANLELLIVRGGTAVSVGNGTTIEGGRVVFRGSPTPARAGNTWVGVEIDPRTGQIRLVDRSDNSGGADGPSSAGALSAGNRERSGLDPELLSALGDRRRVTPE